MKRTRVTHAVRSSKFSMCFRYRTDPPKVAAQFKNVQCAADQFVTCRECLRWLAKPTGTRGYMDEEARRLVQ